jgi:hypothetical protein
MARVALLLALLLAPTLALADPFTLIGFALSAAGFPLTALVVGTIGSILGAADARRKQRSAAAQQRAAYNANLQDRNITALQNDSPWKIVYGSPSPVGGSIVAILTSGAKDEYKHIVIAFANHESAGIDEVYIEGDPVGALDGSGWVTGGAFYEAGNDITVTETILLTGNAGVLSHVPKSLPVAVARTGSPDLGFTDTSYAVGFPDGTNTIHLINGSDIVVSITYSYSNSNARVNVQKHLSPGGVDTADAFLIAQAPGYWGASHKLSDTTYIVLTLDLRFPRFQGGPPNVNVKMRGKLVYDYRTSTTGYSANPALCAADFIRGDYGFSATAGQMDSASIIAAANACDSQGYNCNGVLTTDGSRETNLQSLEDSMVGRTHWSGGVWRIVAGAWATPTMTLTDADLAAPIDVVQAAHPTAQHFNSARGKYSPAAGLGVITDYTPYSVPSYVAADGPARWMEVSFPFTATNAECQKLAAIGVEKSRAGLTINYPSHLRAWPLQPGDRVYVTNAELGFVAKTFRLQDWTHINSAPLGLVLVEDTASMYTGTFSATDPLTVTSNLADPWARPAAPIGLALASGTAQLIKNSDGTILTRVLATWTPSSVRAVLQGGYSQIRWRLAVATDDQWISQDMAADSASTYLTNTPDGAAIIVQVRFLTGVGAQGAWATLAHTVIGKTAPPPDVGLFTIDGLRLNWADVIALDLAGYEIRFQYGTNTWWGNAARLHQGILTASPYSMSQRPVGVVTLLIKAIDTSGNYSTNAAAIVTNLGSPIVNNLFVSWPQAPLFTDGAIVGGTVIGGVLTATATDRAFDPGSQPAFSPDTDLFFPAGTYGDLSYTWSVTPNVAGTLLLDATVVAAAFTIEYQRGSQDAAFAPAGDYAFTPATDLFFGSPTAWAVWPGSLILSATEVFGFRITALGGSTQALVSVATPKLDVPDVLESFNNIVTAAGGTRLPITRTYRVIANVQVTVQTDGNGGTTVTVEDKNAALGPLVTVRNSAGVGVAGLIDSDIQGY